MTAATALLHTPAELILVSCDDLSGIVEFAAQSRHDGTRVNTVALDTTTGETLCDCQGAECGRRCWHMDLVVAAWLATPAGFYVRLLDADALLRYGNKHRLCVDTYRARTGRTHPDDTLALVAARYEWRRRLAAGRAAAPLQLAA